MSKKSSKNDDRQMSILEYLEQSRQARISQPKPEPGSMRVAEKLKESIRAAIKSSPLSIHQIAGELSHLAGESITAEIIYSWTRQSDEANGRPARHIPAEYLPAFCQVVGCMRPIEIMGGAVGLFVLPGPEALRAEVARLDEQINEAKAEKRKRQMLLKEMEVRDV